MRISGLREVQAVGWDGYVEDKKAKLNQ